jgi:hypothetical protein
VVVAEGSVATEGGEKGAKKPRRLSFEEEVEEEDEFEAEYFDADAGCYLLTAKAAAFWAEPDTMY